MSTWFEWLIVTALILGASFYLLKHAVYVLRGIRERRNPSCEGCGMSEGCSSRKN